MLSHLMQFEAWIEEARTALTKTGRCRAAVAEAIIRERARAQALEEQIIDCERLARLHQIEQRDSVVGEVLSLIDAYSALIETGENLTRERLDVPRRIIEKRAYWEGENDPRKLYVPGATFGG